MSNPFIGEIRMFGGNFEPAGWRFCHGQLLPISEHEALFTLIGTTYGGDGQAVFALPDLRGRLPIHQNSPAFVIGQQAGVEAVDLSVNQIPPHQHQMLGTSDPGDRRNPRGCLFARASEAVYAKPGVTTPMGPATVYAAGGGQSHENMQPYLCVNFIISLFGIWPAQN